MNSSAARSITVVDYDPSWPAQFEVLKNRPDLLVVPDAQHSDVEPRFHALGETLSGRQLHVTFTLRAENTLIRVISARAMSRKERTIYETQTEDPA